MRFVHLFAASLLGLAASLSGAQPVALTLSTGNTPLDRKVLEEVSAEAFRRIGLAVKIVSQPSERSLQEANQGTVDGEGLRVEGLEAQFPQLVRVPESFVGISFVAFTRDPSVRLNAGWADLAQHRVAFVHGWKMFEANAIGAKVVQRVDKAEQLFLMLDAGRTDLALYTLADGQAMVRSMGLDRIQAVSPSLKDVDMYLYLNRRHEALVPKLVRALRDMKADGTHARIVTAVRASK